MMWNNDTPFIYQGKIPFGPKGQNLSTNQIARFFKFKYHLNRFTVVFDNFRMEVERHKYNTVNAVMELNYPYPSLLLIGPP